MPFALPDSPLVKSAEATVLLVLAERVRPVSPRLITGLLVRKHGLGWNEARMVFLRLLDRGEIALASDHKLRLP